MSFILVVNRLDVLIKRMEQLIKAITGVEVPPIELPPITITEERLPNRYKLFRIDLATAHADYPLALKSLLNESGAKFASYMSIVEVPAAFSFRLNGTDMDEIDAAVGLEWENFEITEIFITNTAAAPGNIAIINVEWRVD